MEAFPLYQANATLEDREENSPGPKMLRIIQLASRTERTSVAGNWHFRTITKFQALRFAKVKTLALLVKTIYREVREKHPRGKDATPKLRIAYLKRKNV